MRRALLVLLPLIAVAGLVVWIRGGVISTIRDDSVAKPAEPKSPYGHCIEPRGFYTTGIGTGSVFVEAELGTRGPDGAFRPVPRGNPRTAGTFAGVGGVKCWSAGQYMGLPPGNYVVRATLSEGGGATGEPRQLAVSFSKPLTLP